jgi:hypothetical protein
MHAMNDPTALAGMLPFDSIGLYEQPKPRFIFKMPRVVPDQKSKFESDELFRRLSRESEVSDVTAMSPHCPRQLVGKMGRSSSMTHVTWL